MNRYRLLVIANDALESNRLHDLIRRRTVFQPTEVTLVAPSVHAETERLERALDRLEANGVRASGWIAPADPMLAIEDALRIDPADELIVSTGPFERWQSAVKRARASFDLPLTHVASESAAVAVDQLLLDAARPCPAG
jgi:hypothetical protein